ncbi:alpha/beta hydrolase fold domain-containing protein [Pseudonocardia xishanensis]|uniref:Alpha/beta hydrolase fold-3 domain-containing protein n=1 Tax=Pseudonocardia xishanensis TaxID=630995 RepID=A0ABP8S200_9PSEU
MSTPDGPRGEVVVPAERAGVPPGADLLACRSAAADRREVSALGPEARDSVIGGVPCRVVGSPGRGVVVLYLHGGGYRLGTAAAYTGHAAALSRAGGCEVVVVDYRLAPEHPFPAALRDALAVLDALRATDPRRPVVAAGDSAGGGLAVAVAAAAAPPGAPDALALLSPWLDLSCTAETFATAADTLFDRAAASSAAAAYLQGHDARDPLVSPLFVHAARLPPVLVQVGTEDTLLADATAAVSTWARAGVGVTLEVVAGCGHVWPVVDPHRPESTAAMSSAGRFVAGTRRRPADNAVHAEGSSRDDRGHGADRRAR